MGMEELLVQGALRIFAQHAGWSCTSFCSVL